MINVPVIARARGAFLFTTKMSINVDGCPRAYAPADRKDLNPLDVLASAGRPGSWWGIACDPNDNPYIQGPTDPAPGYYVSTTALVDRTKLPRDPRRYVDAAVVPYIVIPPELHASGVRLGDLAMVVYDGKQAPAIVADIGPSRHYGEGSTALAEMLGIPSSARTGGVPGAVRYVIFENSATMPRWPRSILEFQAEAARRYAAWLPK
jgi:hypothetical protein